MIVFNTRYAGRTCGISKGGSPYELHLYTWLGSWEILSRERAVKSLRSFGVEERYTYRRNLVRANFVQKWIIEPITDFVLLVNSRLMRYERNVTRFRDRDIIYSPYRWNSYFVIARSIISDLLGGEGKHDPIRIVALLP